MANTMGGIKLWGNFAQCNSCEQAAGRLGSQRKLRSS